MVASLLAAATFVVTGGDATAAMMVYNFAKSTLNARSQGQDAPEQTDPGVRQQIPPSTTNAIPVVYGDAYLGGTFIDAVLSIDQTTMYYVLAVSPISPNGQFTFDTTDMYYGDRKMQLSGTGSVLSLTDEAGNVDSKISGKMQINLYTSSASGVITDYYGFGSLPSAVMGGADITPALRWPASGRQMNGLAFAVVKLTYSQEAGTTGLQGITFKVKHALNGTGVAKPGDVWYDYITNTIYGGAQDVSYVDSASATTTNSYSDGLITYTPSGGGSATQARYRINGVINAGETVLSNIDKILDACDSWMAYDTAMGKWSLIVNKSETAAYPFDDNNIVGDIRVSVMDITQTINQIEARFPNKGNRDQSDFVNLTLPSLPVNEPVNKYSKNFDLVNDSVQTQYLAKRILFQSREDLLVSFSTTYYGIQVDAGQVISLTNADYGWVAKLFRVMKVNEASLPDGMLGAKIECTEYNDTIYADPSLTEFATVPNSGLSSAEYFSALTAPTVSATRPNASVPSFDVQVTIPALGRVTNVKLYYRTASTSYAILDTTNRSNTQPFVNSSTFVFANEVLPNDTYIFAYSVGNDVGQSAISSASSNLVWNALPDANVQKYADVTVYKWYTGTPSLPSGTSTFKWSDGSFDVPSGWTLLAGTPPSATNGLVAATVNLNALESVTTSTITWSQARLKNVQGTPTTTVEPRKGYTRVTGSPTVLFATITTAGTGSFPSSAQSLANWGFSATWVGADPSPTSTDTLLISDGVYDSGSGNIVWSTPYVASLPKETVAQLAGNSGSFAINGTLTMSPTGAVRGGQTDYATGTGYFLGYSGSAYKFSIGSASNYFRYDGTNVSLFGGTFTSGSSPAISGNTMTGSGALINANGTFALGTATNNIVNNGSGVFIRGFIKNIYNSLLPFSNYSGAAVSSYSQTYTTANFTPISGNMLVSISGYVLIRGVWLAQRSIQTNTIVEIYISGGALIFTNGVYLNNQTIATSPSSYGVNNNASISLPIDLSAYIGTALYAIFKVESTCYDIPGSVLKTEITSTSAYDNLFARIQETNV